VSAPWSTVGLNMQRGRILGAQRAERERWPAWRRVLQAAAFPLFPLLQLRHIRPQMQRLPCHRRSGRASSSASWARLGVLAVAEAWGLLAGAGDAVARMEDYELHRLRHLSRRDREALLAPAPAA
jgi:hypothetical protein